MPSAHLCRFSMLLFRRWCNSCRISFSSSPHSHLFPSRFSKCPRSCLTMFLCDVSVASRSWWNSWLKCRRSFLFPRCSGLWSRTLTFQLLVVMDLVEVFPVLSQDSIFSLPAEQIVANPAHWLGFDGGFQGLQSSTVFLEQIAVSPVPGGGHQKFQPVQSSAVSSSVSPGHAGQWFFSDLSPGQKKVRSPPGVRVRSCSGRSAHRRRRLMRLIMSGVVEMLLKDPSQDRVRELFLEVLKVFSLD